jgi:hypothetical protein
MVAALVALGLVIVLRDARGGEIEVATRRQSPHAG